MPFHGNNLNNLHASLIHEGIDCEIIINILAMLNFFSHPMFGENVKEFTH